MSSDPPNRPEEGVRATPKQLISSLSGQPEVDQTTSMHQNSGRASVEPIAPYSDLQRTREHIQESRLGGKSSTIPELLRSPAVKQEPSTESSSSPVTAVPISEDQRDTRRDPLEDLPLFVGSPADEFAAQLSDNPPQVKKEAGTPSSCKESMFDEEKPVKYDNDFIEDYISISDDSEVEIISVSKKANITNFKKDWGFDSDVEMISTPLKTNEKRFKSSPVDNHFETLVDDSDIEEISIFKKAKASKPKDSPMADYMDLTDDLDRDIDPNIAFAPVLTATSDQKLKKPRKTADRRARTAKEWHKAEQLRLPLSKQRGLAWKKKQLSLLEKSIKSGKSKRHKDKLPKKPAGFDPRILLRGDGVLDHAPVDPRGGALPQLNAKTLKGAWEQILSFIEEDPDMDVHKCKLDWNAIKRAAATLGLGRMVPEDGYWKLKGMLTKLYNHQMLGVAFMVARECSADGPHGSIMADDMGLGKTIQTIATIIANPPSVELVRKNQKTTLIIVPSSIKSQWLAELKKHAPELGENVMAFKAANEDNTITRLKANDIVLTTYWELMKSLPSPPKEIVRLWEQLVKDKTGFDMLEAFDKWASDNKECRGLLQRVHWYRVVIDEGHFIKNYLSRTSRAAVRLKSHHRHILSGTPIMNKYQEFYPLLRFLEEPVTRDLSCLEFEAQYCNEADAQCVKALTIVVCDLIIRRTTNDTLLNKPLLQPPLPIYHKIVKDVSFIPSERLLNGAFEACLAELRAEDHEPQDECKKLQNYLCYLTRLRQSVASPDLVAQQYIAIFKEHQFRKLQSKIKEMMIPGKPKAFANMLYHRITTWIQEKKNGAHKYVSSDLDDLTVCMKCGEPTEDLILIKCKHIFCGACLERFSLLELDEEAGERGEDQRSCPKCRKPYRDSHRKDYHAQSKATARAEPRHTIRMAKDARGFRPTLASTCARRWLQKYDEGNIEIMPSVKLVAVIDQIRNWLREARENKIIVFTQFRHFQVMIGGVLEKLGIKFVYFSGDMTMKQREMAIEEMKTEDSVQVMVAGLKCGGLGLNLNFANRIIITDPWWNSCIDNQAFGRIYRIGQTKETYFLKVAIGESSIDDKILKLQVQKEKDIGTVLQDQLTPQQWKDLVQLPEISFDGFLEGFDAYSKKTDKDRGSSTHDATF